MRHSFVASALVAGAMIASAGGAAAATVFASQIDVGLGGGTGFDATGASFSDSRSDPGNALGAPDQVGNSEGGFFSLGRGGAAVLGFGTPFSMQANLFEVTFDCDGPAVPGNSCGAFPESVDVYALEGDYTPFDGDFGVDELTGLGFVQVGSVGNGVANTAAGAPVQFNGVFRFLALVDTSAQGADGFDVDGVSVVAAVPVPASVLLLLSAIGGLVFLSVRRAA